MNAQASVQASVLTRIDLRVAYAAFAAAWLLGHGSAALARGAVLDLPGWLPWTLLGTGVVAGLVAAVVASVRGRQGATEAELRAEQILGLAWCVGFGALFLAITGLTMAHADPALQDVLWPAGSGLVVGMVYLAEGAVRGNGLHSWLGSWLALVSGAALFLGGAGPWAVLAVAGGGGYLVAVVLEGRRLAG